MGVPKFYRWISERYPCLSEVIREFQIPDFDNLYLDMNGIIHTCSHPNDDDPHFRISEEKIFAGICHYIDFLFKMIKPKKVFFMAIDGVAPRAKMNQQRGRRFRTAKAAIILEDRAKALGENLPTEARFDSNCITPGTEFMARLQNILKGFIIHKISTDKLWQNVRVYLSGHETPGEGEHKIMDFIRYEKSQPGYNPNTRHCLYGLDADLIMLGLCSHEPYFSLLREEVKFGGKKNQKRIMTPEETTFHLLHISLLRDYLYHEFSPIKNKMSFDFNVENIVDDFVLMSFLVGNDFIPHLPQLHIQHDALPVLFKTYMEVIPTLDGYINEQGNLNLGRFEAFLKKLSEYDFKKFGELNDDLLYLNEKSKRKDNSDDNNSDEGEKKNTSDILMCLGFSSMAINKMAEFDSSSDIDEDDKEYSSDDCDSLELEMFNMHKTDYYLNKLEFTEVTPEVLQDQAEGYVRAIQWNLHYYYNGVVSWSWYYPHHYSPYISDVKDFKNMELQFELGKPFLPFQQLLAVLPKLSKDLLPKSYQKLMCENDSPLIDYYPDDFDTDLNGKQQEWEAVVLIPFINEKLLLKFAAEADKELNDEERKRNCHGPHLLYTYDSTSAGSLPSFLPDYYPPLSQAYFKVTYIDPDLFRLPSNLIVKGLPRGVVLDRIMLGFPSLRTLEHTAELKNEKVKVFHMMSMKENMMLTIKETKEKDFQKVAKELVGKTVYVGWPHLREAFVIAVSDKNCQILYDKSKSSSDNIVFMEKEMTSDEKTIWLKQVESVEEHNYQRWGIFIGDTDILIHVKCLSGKRIVYSKEEGKLVENKQWDGTLCNYALQTTVSHVKVFSDESSEGEKPTDFDIFSPGSVVFSLVAPYYGSMGTVVSSELDKLEPTVLVELEIASEPDLMPVIQNQDGYKLDQYVPGYVAAQQLGLEPFMVSHLTGTIFVQTSPKGSSSPNRVNVGLNLKFTSRGEEVVGYTKRKDTTWLYSSNAVKLLNSYLSEFPDFFEIISKYVKQDVIYLEDLYPNGEGSEIINKIMKWLKSQNSASAERQKCGMKKLDSGIIQEIEKIQSENRGAVHRLRKSFNPNQLFCSFMCKGISKPDPKNNFSLFDRVVNVNHSSCVPLGLRGTIIGISTEDSESDTMYEIVFDKEFFGGLTLSCSPGKGYRLAAHSLLNISHGSKLGQKQFNQSPVKKVKGSNPHFNRFSESDTILKHLQSDNMISAVQHLQKKLQTSPGSSKPFYNVNEMFQTQVHGQDAISQNLAFSPNLAEVSSKQFVTPKAGYVGSSFTGKSLGKINTPSPSQSNYQDFWADLKKATPESASKNPQESMYGQKLSVKELFQNQKIVENQKEANYNQNSYARLSSEPQIIHKNFIDRLAQLCCKHFHSPPLYTYHNFGNTRLFISTISLPNGMKVSGVPKEQKHEAAISAAENAIARLLSNRNDALNVQNSNIQIDKAPYSRQPPIFQTDFRPPLLVPNSHFPQTRHVYPMESKFERPLMRHPSPNSNRMPDSFVASNQFLLGSPSQTSAATSVLRQPTAPSDPELFYLPGGGTARMKMKNQQISTSSDSSNLFVPNQVMKQAVKPPLDSSNHLSTVEWPDLLPKNSSQSDVTQNSKNLKSNRPKTCSEALKSQACSAEEKTSASNSSMTILTKKPSRRRIAANFSKPLN